VMSRTEAVDLVLSEGQVTGVVTRKRPAQGDPERLPADVVVDASGRQSKALDWLERAGYPLPPVTKIDAQLGYASRWYTQSAGMEPDWRILYIMPSPPRQTRGGVIFVHEDGRWLVSLGGTNGDHPTTDEADFLEFARSLPDPVIYNAIKDAQPLTSIQGFRNTANVWRAFEKLDRLPGGLFVTGDALCEVNPIYGQGMTKAALNALALREQLGTGNLDHRRFYKEASKINQNFWQSAASGDLNYPGTISTAQETPVERLMRAYFSAVVRGSARDPQVALTFSRVLNVIDPPTDLLKPGMVLRVLRAQRRAPA
jgi:flavin-dependent dehydrogenase